MITPKGHVVSHGYISIGTVCGVCLCMYLILGQFDAQHNKNNRHHVITYLDSLK